MQLDELLPVKVDLPAPPTPIDLQTFPAHGAVYLLTDETDRPIQLAGTERFRRAMVNRLAHRDDGEATRRADLRAVTRRVYYVPTFSQFETTYEFHRVARALYPDSYRDLVGFGSAWFAQMSPADALPRFVVTNRALFKDATTIGPFRSRSQCKQYVELLEDLFDLCRYHDVLDQTPNGEACAYFEMGKCPAPCDGTVPVETYRDAVRSAGRFAVDARATEIAKWQDEMARAAQALAFETAGALKQKLDRAEKLNGKAFRMARPLDEFNFLIVQRAGGRSKLKPFFIHRGQITRGNAVGAKNLSEAIPQWRQQAIAEPDAFATDDVYRDEQVWLVSHFLFKADHAGGLYLQVDDLPTDADLVQLLREKFSLSQPKNASASDKGVDADQGDSTIIIDESKDSDSGIEKTS